MGSPTAPIRPRNVVIVIADDLAWGDLACHGNPFIATPVLDTLHDSAIRLSRYLSGPMCTPARASLMTGRYHQRTRAFDTFCGRAMIDPSEITLAQVFSDAGYRTGAFGKWHLGDAYPMRAMDMGFGTTVVHNAGGIGQPGDVRENHWREGEAYFDPVVLRDGVPERASGFCTDVFTDEAIGFVTAARAAGEPFLCFLATNAPHTPLEVPASWADPYRADPDLGEVHARLYGMVANIDHNVGRLLEVVDRDDTIVIFTSDHGPCPSARDFTLPPDRQVRWNAGLRGEKGSLYQGAVKVPFFLAAPDVAGDMELDVVASPIDVLPTLMRAVGIAREDLALDGVDLWGVLQAASSAPERTLDRTLERTLFLQWHRGNLQERYHNYAVVRGVMKLHRPSPEAADELYDLDADPGETTDIAAQRPGLVTELRAAYDIWFDDVSTTRPDNWAPPRIIVSTDAGPGPVVLTRQDWRIDDSMADMGELDGWLATTPGWWEVAIPEPIVVDVDVRLDPFTWDHPVLATDVNLRIGEAVWTQPWVLQCTLYVFEGLEIPAGDVTVEAWVSGGAPERVSASYVDLIVNRVTT